MEPSSITPIKSFDINFHNDSNNNLLDESTKYKKPRFTLYTYNWDLKTCLFSGKALPQPIAAITVTATNALKAVANLFRSLGNSLYSCFYGNRVINVSKPVDESTESSGTEILSKNTDSVSDSSEVSTIDLTDADQEDKLTSAIRSRAHELYIERGCQDGMAEQDWEKAKAEILGKNTPQ